ncbi:MAG TPA: hypothetical protein VGQ57_15910 [Polyangiaceae bacterium]|nr:hypothetical protein [Polyangiaceae bacterium]
MSTYKTWSILSVGLLAMACATAGKPDARHSGEQNEAAPASTEGQSSLPGEGQAQEGTAEEKGASAEAPATSELDEAPAPTAPAPASAGPTGSRAGVAPKPEARLEDSSRSAPAKKSRDSFEVAPERPGLGTTWGETRSSRVSNAPFERASSNPFALTTVFYNDQQGITAMLHGAARENVGLAAFRTDAAATVGNGLSVRLVNASGAPLPTFAGGGRNLAQGEVGDRYIIEIVNQSSNRFEAVVSVDGLDVMDGRAGSLSKRGYLVAPFATVDIDGFRQNMDEVAAFRFGSVRGSYAGQKGNDRNVGVIGVAFFAERGANPWNERELGRRESADPFPGRFASPPAAR